MNSRKRAVSVKLNIDELYLLGERVIWKINKFLNLKYHVYGNDRSIHKKIKTYVKLLNKICNIDNVKPFLNDVAIKFTSSEIALIWEALSKLDDEYIDMLDYLNLSEDTLHSLIYDINRCDIFYKDLKYYQIVYIYLYTEFAIAMRESRNQNIYINGTLLRVRDAYISNRFKELSFITPGTNIVDEESLNKITSTRIKLINEQKEELNKLSLTIQYF